MSCRSQLKGASTKIVLVAFDLLYLNGRDLWVEPKLLAEIEYQAKSAEGKVRHPFFKGCEDL
jgi:ATP-dependent DNA ligase